MVSVGLRINGIEKGMMGLVVSGRSDLYSGEIQTSSALDMSSAFYHKAVVVFCFVSDIQSHQSQFFYPKSGSPDIIDSD